MFQKTRIGEDSFKHKLDRALYRVFSPGVPTLSINQMLSFYPISFVPKKKKKNIYKVFMQGVQHKNPYAVN